jgi:hypothetical protein
MDSRASTMLVARSLARVSDPVIAEHSKMRGMGPIHMWPCTSSVSARGGPARTLHRRPVSGDSDRSAEIDRLIQVKVGGAVAGRAFRCLLGFAWRKIERGEQVVQQPNSNAPMNGDGGHGGFNPGRGGFNHGRGGFQSRGGFANGRPAMLYADVWGKVAADTSKTYLLSRTLLLLFCL